MTGLGRFRNLLDPRCLIGKNVLPKSQLELKEEPHLKEDTEALRRYYKPD